MPWIEKEGRSVEEARAAAVAAAGISEAELEVEVLREGAKGLFGLGGEPALVRVRPRSEARDVRDAFRSDLPPPGSAPPPSAEPPSQAPPPAAEATEPPPAEMQAVPTDEVESATSEVSLPERQEEARQIGEEMVRGILQRMGLDGEVTGRVSGGTVYVEVFGEEMGILIGRGGATLEALQELVRAGVQRRLKTRQAVVVDVEAYWERRRGRRRDPGRREGSRGGRQDG